MPQQEVWTVGRLLTWTTDYLKGRGAETPRLDAELLLAEALGCQRIELYTAYDEVPGDAPRALFRGLVRRRGEGTPVAYLLGRREFYSLSFRVTPDVLIPRPETEHLVVALLDLAREHPRDRPVTVCDVGTGSGCVAVCAARHLPDCRVTAIDVSRKALEVARANCEDHGVAERVDFVESDLLDAVAADRRFDFVVSNPPYVSGGEMDGLPPDVREHEPRLALDGGERGTDVIARLVPQAAAHLGPGGHLLVEISPMIHAEVSALVEADGRFRVGPTVEDLDRRPRVIQAARK